MIKKVMVVDDSALMRRAVSDIINSTNKYHVEFLAANGLEAIEIIDNNQDIDVILSDLNMPEMDGLDLLRYIVNNNIPIPFIMFSSNTEIKNTITALELGAIDFVKKPDFMYKDSEYEFKSKLLNAVRIASIYKNKCDYKKVASLKNDSKDNNQTQNSNIESKQKVKGGNKIVALACSTGGPKALQYVIPKLPANLAAPVVIVQHMPAGFTESLAQRLDSLSEVKVKEAKDGEILQKGVVYIAKGGTHLTVLDGRIKFNDEPPVVGLKPCANFMYESLVEQSYDEIICVVLTGMGADGTSGINNLKKAGKSIYVISQDEHSSTVYGMPKVVFENGLSDMVCDINNIAAAIVKKVGVL